MLSDGDIEAAHPEAFDCAFGNLAAAKQAEFNRHLSSCPHCYAVVDEYRDIGQIIKLLPPHVEPAPDLEDRTVAAMVAALAGNRPGTSVRPLPRTGPPPGSTRFPNAGPSLRPSPGPRSSRYLSSTIRLRTSPGSTRSASPSFPAEPEREPDTSPAHQPAPLEPPAGPMVTRLPVWRRYRGRLAAIVAAAAVIIGATALLLPGSSPSRPRSPSSSRFMSPPRPRHSASVAPADRQPPARPAKAGHTP
jgi:hypothetical protein